MELTLEHFRAMIFYDLKGGVNQDESIQRLQLAFGNERPSCTSAFR